MDFAGMAQDFIEATSMFVNSRTINLMDTNAIIIASTDKKRVGDFHQGAADVIRTGRPVLIRKEEVDRYPGSKEGCNLPVYDEDKLVGVVGIYGMPEEISDLANLLKVYVTQFMRQELFVKKQLYQKELYAQIVRLLFGGGQKGVAEAIRLCAMADIQFSLPVRIYYFLEQGQAFLEPEDYSELKNRLSWKKIFSPRQDIGCAFDGGLLWIRREDPGALAEMEKKLLPFLKENARYKLYVSRLCTHPVQIERHYQEIVAIRDLKEKDGCQYYCMEQASCLQRYLFSQLGKAEAELVAEMQKKLEKEEKKTVELFMATALAYFDADGSVTKAAGSLHIHKNTLLYRLNRLFELLGLTGESSFTKELFIRLLASGYTQ